MFLKEIAKMGTALIYDEEMTKYKLLWVEIEVPERLTVSHQALIKCGLADRCVAVPVRQATDEEILLVHSEEYLEAVKKTPYMTLEDLQMFTLQYGDVYFHPNIYHCAKLAVGAALQLVDSVMTGKVRNGMALVRPPGHHSMRSAANGFCVFNNVAIAARYAKIKYGLKRVLIVDWDIHHGQGIQYCFENDPSVLYFSWHRYEHQKFWPNLRESDYDAVGKDKGVGFNVNVPWNKVGMTNSDFLTIFCHILLPTAYEFGPDLVLVCAGFDSAIGDPEGEMSASPDVFAHLTHLLMNLAGGKLCALLEGGYNLTSLPQSVCQTVQTLLGDPAPPSANLSGPCRSAIESLQCVRSAHRPYWSCFSHAAELPTFDISTKRAKLTEADAPQASEEEKKDCAAVAEWPEPPRRVAPLIRTAAVLPDGIECPDRCQRFCSSEDPNPSTVRKMRDTFFKDGNDSGALQTFATLTALVEKMLKHEVGSGLALISNVAAALACVAQHTAAALNKRVLVVCVGDMMELIPDTEGGKTVLVHFSSKEADEQKGKHQVPVCLKKGCSDVPAFMQAVLSLLLPLGYEFNPSLVLLVRTAGSDVCDSAWQQLTCLLQGLAQGHTLVLMPEEAKSHVATTVSCLLGDAAAPLGPLRAPLADHMEALERLRHHLQNEWKLLRTITTGNGEFPES